MLSFPAHEICTGHRQHFKPTLSCSASTPSTHRWVRHPRTTQCLLSFQRGKKMCCLYKFFLPWNAHPTRGPGSSRLLREEAPQKRRSGGSKDARDVIGLSIRLRIALWNCASLSNFTIRSCKELGFDMLGLTETHGWHADPTAMYLEQPTAGDKYAGCCISLSERVKGAVIHSGSLGSRIVFACIRGWPANLFDHWTIDRRRSP